jgi:hypothetical protein
LATVFVVSAIAGWVSATVAGIKTLIVAYNLLKTSAIVAGVASAFALNPLLGVGAAALAAGVLSAGIAISNRYNTSAPGASDLTGMESTGLSAGLYGSTPVNGGPSAKTGMATGGTTGLGSSAPSSGATAISSSNDKALANIDKLQKDVDKNLAAANKALEVANAASAKADAFFPISAGDLSYQDSFRSSPMNNTYITVNGALNSEQTARQLISIFNDSQARGTQGATNLITTPGGMGF